MGYTFFHHNSKAFRILLTWLLIAAAGVISAGTLPIDHWETVVQAHHIWRYHVGTAEPPSGWNQPGFDDSAWLEGPGGIGYGDGDDATLIAPTLSLYLRISFDLADTAVIAAMLLHVDYDDGFIAWINGYEVARANMGEVGSHVPFNRPSTGHQEAMLYRGLVPHAFRIDEVFIREHLNEGQNLLALQVNNQDLSSSDMSSACWLSLGITDQSFTYSEPPPWFEPPLEFVSSDLPIIVINTGGMAIPDDPKITVSLGIIDNGPGMRNYISDPYNGYSGLAGIEIKGESSQMFPKKSYFLETRDSLGENRNVSLLGMPQENDWVLYAPYTDKSIIRNSLTFSLGEELGRYAPRTRFCELVLNGDYMGIYVLMERIKRDKNRVSISNLEAHDLAGDALTGGYILRVDKHDSNDPPGWTSVPALTLPGERNIFFQYYRPRYRDLAESQRSYIRNYIYEFETILSSYLFDNPSRGYARYIDIPSFIDYIIMTEISKNIDGYVFSTYMYKDRDSKGGLLHMGPLWDFDLAYGNLNYNDLALKTPGWLYTENYRMYWFRRLMQDPKFRNHLRCRWDELRPTVLSNASVLHKIDSMVDLISEAQERNFRRWKILGQYVWPNDFIGQTFAEEVDYLKDWIVKRLDWISANIGGSCEDLALGLDKDNFHGANIFPNPFFQHLVLVPRNMDAGQHNYRLQLFDALGRIRFDGEQYVIASADAPVVFSVEAHDLQPGLYFARIYIDGVAVRTEKLVRGL